MAKTKSRIGRQTKLTPEVQEKIISAIHAGNYACVAVEYAGISTSTFYVWLQRGNEETKGIHRDFLEAVKKAESSAEVRAVAMVQKHMADNWQAAMTYLERKFPDRWGRRDRLKVEVEPQKVLASLLGLDDEALDSAVDLAAQHGDRDRGSG